MKGKAKYFADRLISQIKLFHLINVFPSLASWDFFGLRSDKTKSRLARRRFSQKKEKSIKDKFVSYFFWRIYGANLLTVLSVF